MLKSGENAKTRESALSSPDRGVLRDLLSLHLRYIFPLSALLKTPTALTELQSLHFLFFIATLYLVLQPNRL